MDKNNNFKSFTPKAPNTSSKKDYKQEETKVESKSIFKEYEVNLTGVPLNIRKEPQLNAAILRVITSAEQHKVINEVQDWIQLEDSSWVMKKFTSLV